MNRIRTSSFDKPSYHVAPVEDVPSWLWGYVAPIIVNLPPSLLLLQILPVYRLRTDEIGIDMSFRVEGRTNLYTLRLYTNRQALLTITVLRSQVEATKWEWEAHEHQQLGALEMSEVMLRELTDVSSAGIL